MATREVPLAAPSRLVRPPIHQIDGRSRPPVRCRGYGRRRRHAARPSVPTQDSNPFWATVKLSALPLVAQVSLCDSCVQGQDSWCGSNTWDDICLGFCTSSCSASCGADSSSGAQQPSDMIPTWDSSTISPRDYHSIHDLGASNSYLYAPDELDLRLKASVGPPSLSSFSAPSSQYRCLPIGAVRKCTVCRVATARACGVACTCRVAQHSCEPCSASPDGAAGVCVLLC